MKRLAIASLIFFGPAIAVAANQSDLEKLLALKQSSQPTSLDLSHADLRNYPFIPGKIDLQHANISHSNLAGVDLSKMNLAGVDFSYTDLSGAKLNQVNLAGANLEHANLNGAQIQESNLANANLSKALLIGANLQHSDFKNADFTCANLNEADLTKSNFAAANISGTSFINTITNDVAGYDSVIDTKLECTS